jgi:CAAX prenyl protease-like protein
VTLLRTRIAEIAAAAVTGALHPLFVEVLHAKALFIALAFVGWGTYFFLRVRRNPSVLPAWGFRRENLLPACLASAVVLICGVLAIVLAAKSQSLGLHWHMVPLFLLYPLWGLVQQFLVQALFVRNLKEAGASAAIIVLAAAVLFGIVHLPDVKLTLMTAALGLVLTPIYLRWRNLWPLAVCHGWLGFLAYFWLLGRDPWMEVFG